MKIKKQIWLTILVVAMLIQFSCEENGVEPILPTDTTWTFLGLKGETINSMAIDPTTPEIIYVSGFRKLLKTTDGGNTWDSLYQTGFLSMAIDPKNPETIYGGTYGVIKSTDGGHTWKSSSEGIIFDGFSMVHVLGIDPNRTNILYAGTRSFYKSVDAGSSWTALDYRVGGGGGITSMTIDPTNNNILYVGTVGIYKSTDAGENWTFAEDGPSSFVWGLVVDVNNPQKIIAGCTRFDGVIQKSENGGESWENFAEGIPEGSNVMRLTSRKSNGDLYALLSTLEGGGIYRRRYSDTQWQKKGIDSVEVVNEFHNDLKIDSNERYLYFASNGGVFRLKLN